MPQVVAHQILMVVYHLAVSHLMEAFHLMAVYHLVGFLSEQLFCATYPHTSVYLSQMLGLYYFVVTTLKTVAFQLMQAVLHLLYLQARQQVYQLYPIRLCQILQLLWQLLLLRLSAHQMLKRSAY